MNREIRDLMIQQAAAEQRVRDAITEGKTDEGEKAMKQVRDLKAQVAMLEELETQAANTPAGAPAGTPKGESEIKAAYERVFSKALRNRRFTAEDRDAVKSYEQAFGIRADVMHGGGASGQDDGDSALVVPIDRQTRINELRRELNDLSVYVRNETVSTLSGSRVLESDDDMTPLSQVNEYTEITEGDNPKFTDVEYKLIKRAGILPLTNELLADNDANLLSYVENWLARKIVVTYNTLVIATLKALAGKPQFANMDQLNEVLNITLDPAVSASAVILTNQDGYHWLDSLVDGMGRPMLMDDITQAGRKMFKGRPVAVASNRHLKTTGDNAPFFVGDLQQAAVLFTRGRYELASTSVGGNAWRYDTTELRVITRDDCVEWDGAAAVFGKVDVSS